MNPITDPFRVEIRPYGDAKRSRTIYPMSRHHPPIKTRHRPKGEAGKSIPDITRSAEAQSFGVTERLKTDVNP